MNSSGEEDIHSTDSGKDEQHKTQGRAEHES